MTIKTTELFISIGIVLITYFVSAPLIGFVRAWTAYKVGDETPATMGFLTLEPFAHVSRIWVVLIVWLQVLFGYMPFGLGRYIPINPLNIQGKRRGLKLAAAYFADTAAAFLLAIFAFFCLFAQHGMKAVELLTKAVTLNNLSSLHPGTATVSLIITWLLVTFYIMAGLMAAFSLIINCFHFVYFYYFENSLRNNEYADMIMLFVPLILLYMLIGPVRGILMWLIRVIAYFCASFAGFIH